MKVYHDVSRMNKVRFHKLITKLKNTFMWNVEMIMVVIVISRKNVVSLHALCCV